MHHTSAFHHGALPIIPPWNFMPLSLQLSMLFLNRDVQSISLRFGHVIVLPEGFRAVAEQLLDGRISVRVDAAYLANDGSVAEYDSETNGFVFASDQVLWTSEGRATAVHEGSHAVADLRKLGTAIRHEEGAAFLCEAWYLLSVGGDARTATTQVIADAAADLRARAAQGRPVRATATQINAVRAEMARTYGYENGFYGNDG